MKKAVSILLILFFWLSSFCQINPNHVRVKSYYKKDGTYVRSHYRTAPNATNRDNFSTIGNTNPYTGKRGWIKKDKNRSPTYTGYVRSKPTKNTLCLFSDCDLTVRPKQRGDYDYSRYSNNYTHFCSTHTPLCINPNCEEHARHSYSDYEPFCNKHKYTCSINDCLETSKLLQMGDNEFNSYYDKYSKLCYNHTPTCTNPQCDDKTILGWSDYEDFCLKHKNTCKVDYCFKTKRIKIVGDYGYDRYKNYLDFCSSHSPKCNNPKCTNFSRLDYYHKYNEYCLEHINTCEERNCFEKSMMKSKTDYGFDGYYKYLSYCNEHNPKCRKRQCDKTVHYGSYGYEKRCINHLK